MRQENPQKYFFFQVGERGGRGKGSAVTSLVNGVGHVGSMVEGPLVGLVWGATGWTGVLILALIISFVGTLKAAKAQQIDQDHRRSFPFVT